jgi:hypothetical protein
MSLRGHGIQLNVMSLNSINSFNADYPAELLNHWFGKHLLNLKIFKTHIIAKRVQVTFQYILVYLFLLLIEWYEPHILVSNLFSLRNHCAHSKILNKYQVFGFNLKALYFIHLKSEVITLELIYAYFQCLIDTICTYGQFENVFTSLKWSR